MCDGTLFQGGALRMAVKLSLQPADSSCWAHYSPQAPPIVSTNAGNRTGMTVIKYHLSADFQAFEAFRLPSEDLPAFWLLDLSAL